MIGRREFLGTLAAAGSAFGQGLKKPNVVILLADDLGWADVGYHKSEIQTPNLDALAREGMRLERFYSFPVCSPTRSALMTGRSPMRLGLGYTVIRPWSQYGLPLGERTIAAAFREAGYETAMTGKWHLGHARRAFLPGGRGFEHSYGHLNGAIDYYTHLREGGLDWHRNGKALEEEGYSTTLIGREAERLIRSRDKSRPFFLYVPFNAPHTPLQAPPALIDKYAAISDEKRRVFAAMVDSMDSAVGGILSALRDQGMADDTIVLFFSDNGGPVSQGARNTPLRGAKGSTFEGGIRVPAILRWPGQIKPGSVQQQVMTAWDVFPTLAAAAGVRPGNEKPLDGKNLWPVLTGKQAVSRREDLFFSVEAGDWIDFAVLRGGWKLVMTERPDGSERKEHLFRIEDDPGEKQDLAATNPELVRDLRARITEWRKTAPKDAERFSSGVPKGFQGPKKWVEAAKP